MPHAPYQDKELSPESRAQDLLGRLTVEDKVGLMFHQMTTIPDDGNLHAPMRQYGLPSFASMVQKRKMTHFNLVGGAETPREMAQWYNAAQRLCLETGPGIPLTLSSDPRHSFIDNPFMSGQSGPMSQWPEMLGLAAIGKPELVRTFADIARQEYLAVGIRLALHPQADLATEPRWSRAVGTFGQSMPLASTLIDAYIRGFQGSELGPASVACMTKHFPGGGPQLDGEDPHFEYGKDQVYPGNNFDYHLAPFEAAIKAGTSQIMPYYGRPIGTKYPELGFAFNKPIVGDLLRDTLGFTGILCSDWTVLTDARVFDRIFPARAWGLEHLTRAERMLVALDAGVDQFGGEICTPVLADLLHNRQVSEDRLDISALKLLVEKFRLGLFDDPYVDISHAERIVGRADFVEAGLEAQRSSVTVLKNSLRSDGVPFLPISGRVKIYAEGMDQDLLAREDVEVVTSPVLADLAILRLACPFEKRPSEFEAYFHSGSLAFTESEIERVTEICQTVPTILDLYLERPAILTPFIDEVSSLIGTFGVSDPALLDVLFGRATPHGRLPFDLPSSMAAVEAGREDTPGDTKDPLFRAGFGLDL